jgi:hypothetical protein
LPALRLLAPPPLALEVGATLRPFLRVDVSDGTGRPLAGQTVVVSLELEDALESILTVKYGFNGTPFDGSGLPIGATYAFPGFPPRPLQQATLLNASAISDDAGQATFRGLTVLTALPYSYLLRARVEGSAVPPTTLGRLRLTSAVATVELLLPAASTLRAALGGALRGISVRVLDARGAPLAGKTALLFSAPPEAAEFASLLASSDVLHPRHALLAGAQSTRSGLDGLADFPQATLVGSSLRRARLWASVDGVIARLQGSEARAVELAVDEPPAGFKLTLLAPPSSDVVEGESLAAQPTVRVMRRAADGALAPAPGTVVFAFPLAQRGFRNTRTVMSPENVAELAVVGATQNAVLGNLGRAKSLFNFASAPADEAGLAVFSGLGFARHGPAGAYTLGFAVAGLSPLESPTILVRSSVAEVRWHYGGLSSGEEDCFAAWEWGEGSPQPRAEGACNVFSHVCNYPSCVSVYSTNSGSVLYDGDNDNPAAPFFIEEELLAPDASNINGSFPFRSAPSGALSSPLVLVVKDAAGRPLAGKSALPRARPLSGSGAVEFAEFPFSGASVSRLSLPAFMTAANGGDARMTLLAARSNERRGAANGLDPRASPYEGGLAFIRFNIPASTDVRRGYALEVNDPGAFLRVVTAPSGKSTHNLTFFVEGVDSPSLLLRVDNKDAHSLSIPLPPATPPAPALCAHINIISSPAKLLQDGSTLFTPFGVPARPQPFLAADGTPAAFRVRAVNSFGSPLAGVSVSMLLMDALGYTMLTTTGGDHLGLRPEYSFFLRTNGGVGAHTLGNRTASLLGTLLHGPVGIATTDADGVAVFPNVTFRRSMNTWIKVGFAVPYFDIAAAEVGSTEENYAQYFSRHASCVSEYSTAIAIDSNVAAVEWAAPGRFFELDGRVNSSAPLDLTLPPLRVSGPAGKVPPQLLYAVIDECVFHGQPS